MRIGIDSHYFRFLPPRGIYYYLWNLLDALCRLDQPHRLTCFLYGQPWYYNARQVREWRRHFANADFRYYWDGPAMRLLSQSVHTRSARLAQSLVFIDRHFTVPLWRKCLALERRYPNGTRGLSRWWREYSPAERVDVFHHVAGLVFPLHHAANVLTIHDLIPLQYPQFCPPMTIEEFRASFENAHWMDIILTYSEFTKRSVIDLLGIPDDKIRMVPLAASPRFRPIEDRTQIEPVLRKYGLAGRPYVFYLGGTDPRKNLSRLVGAFRLLLQDTSLGHDLVLAGDREWLDQGTLDQMAHAQLASRVRCLGFVPREDVPALMNGADLFVFPSLCEGFGLPPLEAMACGTAVVASRTTAVPEVVGDAGLLFDPLQVDDMTATMHRVLTDRNLHQALRHKAIARARTFSWENTARLTLAAYEDAWARSHRRTHKRPPSHPPSEYRTLLREDVIGSANGVP